MVLSMYRSLDCDFYVFSGHKIYGPTGIGVLYGKEKWLSELPPYQGGGDMVEKVTFEKTTYNELPFKFEAGTMNYAGAIGLGRALDYVSDLGRDDIAGREKRLLDYATKSSVCNKGTQNLRKFTGKDFNNLISFKGYSSV